MGVGRLMYICIGQGLVRGLGLGLGVRRGGQKTWQQVAWNQTTQLTGIN